MLFKEKLKKICDFAVLQDLIEGADATKLLSYKVSTELSVNCFKQMADIVDKEQFKNGYTKLSDFLEDYPRPVIRDVPYFQRIFQVAVETMAFEILEEQGELFKRPAPSLSHVYLEERGLLQ